MEQLTLSVAQKNSLEQATATFEKNVDRLASFLEPRGISREVAVIGRLGCPSEPIPGFERFVGWMSIPYITPTGVVAMKFRRLDEGTPKYDGPAGQRIRLYNVMALHSKGDTIVICEGELDALVCSHIVGVPAVGTWGTNWLDHHPRCFADFENVLIVADNDVKDDGSNPGEKHAKHIQKTIPHSRIVMPPPGEDMNSWILRDGVEAVQYALS